MARSRLRDERYEHIKKVAVRTLKECNIRSVPIDPFQICKIRGYKLIKYTEKYNQEEMEKICSNFPNGFNYILNGERIIEYNNTQSKERIRTTIFHEIGHIELKHTCVCSLAETEAEWFGVYIIAPAPLVDLYELEDSVELSVKFGTSIECGYYCMRRYIKWKRRAWILKDYEKEIVKLFKEKDELSNMKEEVMQN